MPYTGPDSLPGALKTQKVLFPPRPYILGFSTFHAKFFDTVLAVSDKFVDGSNQREGSF
jgi:hypothetical protein